MIEDIPPVTRKRLNMIISTFMILIAIGLLSLFAGIVALVWRWALG